MRMCAKSIGCLCFLVAAVSAAGWATQVVHLSPQDMGRQSDIVVRGNVIEVEAYWNAKHTKIFTRTRIAIEEAYKGTVGPVIDVIQLGGTVGNVKVTVHGAVEWKPGEEVLIFAEAYDASSYQISGLSQGKFGIERDPQTGRAYVQAPSLGGMSLLGTPPQQGPVAGARTQRVPLTEFVRQALGRQTGEE